MLLFLSLLPLLLLGGANAQNITVQCNATYISIIVKRSYLQSLVDFPVQTLSYKNTAGLFPADCLATDDGTNVNYTTANFSHCSSGNMVFSDHVTYNYTAVLTTSQGSAVVTRDAVYEFSFGCTYSTKYNVSTSNFVSVFKPDVVAGANGTGNFASQIFLTNAMGQPVGSSFKHGDMIKVEISTPNVAGVVLKLGNCYTSPSNNATNTTHKVDLIVGGCAQADTTVTQSVGTILKFGFLAKQFASLTVSQQFLYLHCTNEVCLASDMTCQSAPSCVGRRRRSLRQAQSQAEFRLTHCDKIMMGCEDDCDVTEDGNSVCLCRNNKQLGQDGKSCVAGPASLVDVKPPSPPHNPPRPYNPPPLQIQHFIPTPKARPRPSPRPHHRPITTLILNYAVYAAIGILCIVLIANVIMSCRQRHKGHRVNEVEKEALIQ